VREKEVRAQVIAVKQLRQALEKLLESNRRLTIASNVYSHLASKHPQLYAISAPITLANIANNNVTSNLKDPKFHSNNNNDFSIKTSKNSKIDSSDKIFQNNIKSRHINNTNKISQNNNDKNGNLDLRNKDSNDINHDNNNNSNIINSNSALPDYTASGRRKYAIYNDNDSYNNNKRSHDDDNDDHGNVTNDDHNSVNGDNNYKNKRNNHDDSNYTSHDNIDDKDKNHPSLPSHDKHTQPLSKTTTHIDLKYTLPTAPTSVTVRPSSSRISVSTSSSTSTPLTTIAISKLPLTSITTVATMTSGIYIYIYIYIYMCRYIL
jgi:hypothetical protein